MAGPVEPSFSGPRRRLLETLQANGITDLAVLRAFDLTPRHLFVPTGVRHRAYEDAPLPIGNGQTISQPWVVARGTGSGYQTVLLSHLAGQVFSIERIGALLDRARDVVRQLGGPNISLLQGDGTLGWNAYAPYDAILVGAAAPDVPMPLVRQLAEGGRLLVPVGGRDEQMLAVFTRRGDDVVRRDILPVRFVPLIGAHGWHS